VGISRQAAVVFVEMARWQCQWAPLADQIYACTVRLLPTSTRRLDEITEHDWQREWTMHSISDTHGRNYRGLTLQLPQQLFLMPESLTSDNRDRSHPSWHC